ncbi:DotG/IcmE/VirB10 family protein, partial [Thiolapillus sp.]
AQIEQYLTGREAGWAALSGHGTTVVQYEPPPVIKEGLAASSEKDKQATAVSGAARTVPPELKALLPGDVLFISSDVSVDSDLSIPPVAGTVVHADDPRLVGARLDGTYKRSDDHLVIEYNHITLSNGVTYTMRGYAMDARKKTLAVASDVDHHYWERWGGLIASALLEGASEAVLAGGTTQTTIGPGGTVETVIRDLSTEEQVGVALGRVGDRVSNVLASQFNRPPTVTLDPDILVAVMIFEVQK